MAQAGLSDEEVAKACQQPDEATKVSTTYHLSHRVLWWHISAITCHIYYVDFSDLYVDLSVIYVDL